MSLGIYPSHPEEDELPCCQKCGGEMEWSTCWVCHGEGYFDEHDDDAVNYAEGEELTPCSECRGNGGYLECQACIEKSAKLTEQP